MNHSLLTRNILLFFFLTLMQSSYGQVVFQIERFNETTPEKYHIGSQLEYMVKSLPGEWFKQQIIEIKDKEKMIIFENGYVLLSDIIKTRKPKHIMNYLSKSLYGFGAGWFLFGGIATLSGDYEPGWDTLAIGGTSLLGGWFFSKFKYQITKVNKRNRLRIIDISWPEPTSL